MGWRNLIKLYHRGWLTVWVYRLTPPWDFFGRPIHFEVIRIERRIDNHWLKTVYYGNAREARRVFMEWTKHSKLIERDRKFMEKTEKEENEHQDIRPQLKVVTGGKPPWDSINWLEELTEGTTFLCRDRNDNKVVDLEKYTLVLRFDKSSWLSLHLIDRIVDPVYVDTLRFSLRKEYIETIEEV